MTQHLPALRQILVNTVRLDAADVQVLAGAFGRPRAMAAKRELPLDDGGEHRAFLIEQGWACTYKVLPSGSRQIVEIAVPGDIIGLCSLLVRRSDLLAITLTPAVVSEITLRGLERCIAGHPGVAEAVLAAGARQASIVEEHLVDLGRRTAAQRLAHLILELHDRLAATGRAADGRFGCPLSQTLLADALGLTAIHLNRTLRQLRTSGLIVMRDGSVEILDGEGLRRLAGYDGSYLAARGFRPPEDSADLARQA